VHLPVMKLFGMFEYPTPPAKSGIASEAENQPQRCVNRAKLVETEMAYVLAETAGIDGARLLGEH
jgi:hypothetical protein